MGPMQQERLRPLTLAEQRELKTITKASSERLDRVRRAAAVLAVARGQSFEAAAREAGLRSGTTVSDLVRRFNRAGLGALRIAAGRGRRPTYAAAARARIVATAPRPACPSGARTRPARIRRSRKPGWVGRRSASRLACPTSTCGVGRPNC